MSNTLIADTIGAVADLDPALVTHRSTHPIVEAGAQLIVEVTERYGCPETPLWASGPVEQDIWMGYHNGGLTGHSSTGEEGAGVPRGVLLIAGVINAAAGREVVDLELRAATFLGACAHDHTQLCGRALLEEGQGPGRGDERLSAETAHERARAVASPEVADLAELAVQATAFDPRSRAQNVRYSDTISDRAVLAQEITAAADLLSLTGRRGPLGSVEMILESLCLRQRGQLIQHRIRSFSSIDSTPWLLDLVGDDTELRAEFAKAMAGQAAFFAGHTYTDNMIRKVCGAGINEMFPGREANVAMLELWAALLRDNIRTPREIWTIARDLAH